MSEDLAILADAKALKIEGLPEGVRYIFDTYNNDLQFDSSGLIRVNQEKAKLVQSILKILLTDIGFMAEDTEYGSGLNSFVGRKMDQEAYTDLIETIQAAIIHYNSLYADTTDSTEYVETIESIDVSADVDDKRKVLVTIKLTNEAGDDITLVTPIITQ